MVAAVPPLWWCQISILLVKPEFSSVQSPILHVFLSWNSSKPITSVSKPTLFPFNRNLRHLIAHVWWSNPYVSWTFFIIYVIPIIYIYNYTKYIFDNCIYHDIVYTIILYILGYDYYIIYHYNPNMIEYVWWAVSPSTSSSQKYDGPIRIDSPFLHALNQRFWEYW